MWVWVNVWMSDCSMTIYLATKRSIPKGQYGYYCKLYVSRRGQVTMLSNAVSQRSRVR
jgi:hypothetical protein